MSLMFSEFSKSNHTESFPRENKAVFDNERFLKKKPVNYLLIQYFLLGKNSEGYDAKAIIQKCKALIKQKKQNV